MSSYLCLTCVRVHCLLCKFKVLGKQLLVVEQTMVSIVFHILEMISLLDQNARTLLQDLID